MNRFSRLVSVGDRVRRSLARIRERRGEPAPITADVFETSADYTVIMDAPDAEEDQIQLRYVDGALMVRIERFREAYEGFELLASNRALSHEQRIELPDDAVVSPEGGEATLRTDGTLRIILPKEATDIEAKPSAKTEE